jgi:hypothetical protein
MYPPKPLRAAVAKLLATLGPTRAASKLKVRREALVAIAAGTPVLQGTIVLVELRLREAGAAA